MSKQKLHIRPLRPKFKGLSHHWVLVVLMLQEKHKSKDKIQKRPIQSLKAEGHLFQSNRVMALLYTFSGTSLHQDPTPPGPHSTRTPLLQDLTPPGLHSSRNSLLRLSSLPTKLMSSSTSLPSSPSSWSSASCHICASPSPPFPPSSR